MSKRTIVVVGSYTVPMGHTAGKGNGVSFFEFDASKSDMLTKISETYNCGHNPASLYVNKKQTMLYNSNEFYGHSGIMTSKIDGNFNIGSQFFQSNIGDDTCFVSADKDDNFLYTASYGGNKGAAMAIFKINPINGLLSPKPIIYKEFIKGCNAVPERQERAHIHCIQPNPHNPFIYYIADLGRDVIEQYKIIYDNKMDEYCTKLESSVSLNPGAGARHIAFNNKMNGLMYISEEISNKVTVIKFCIKTGKLKKVVQSVSSLDDNKSISYTSHILVDNDGKYLYILNRITDTMCKFMIDSQTGLLIENSKKLFDCKGFIPRHFSIDPSNNYILIANQERNKDKNQDSNIAIFKIDKQNNGDLVYIQSIPIGSPAWIQSFYQIKYPETTPHEVILSKL